MKKLGFGWRMGILVAAVGGGIGVAAADLPSLQSENRWLGYFVGVENRNSQLSVNAKTGRVVLRAMGKTGKPVAEKVCVIIDFKVLETLPNGTTKVLKLIPGSLESDQEATHDLKNVTIRGKVSGEASFEFTLNDDRGKLSLGGQVVDAGKITNPVRFAILVGVQNAYPSEKANPDKKLQKAFENKTKGDRMQLILADGKRLRRSTSERIIPGKDGLDGMVATTAQIEFSSWAEKRMDLQATGGSTLLTQVVGERPLWKGFGWLWSADPQQDPASKPTLEIEMK